MKIKNIINEELNKIFNLNQEGVADIYGERMFGIPDPNTEQNKIAMSGIKSDDNSMGELVGVIKTTPSTYGDNNEMNVNVYLNPKSLNDFDKNVRAITHINGNLFIAQINGKYNHGKIADTIEDNYNIGSAYDSTVNLTWHRIDKTNNFGFSVTSMREPDDKEVQEYVIKNIDNARRLNPQFNFIPIYWEDLLNKSYNAKELIEKSPYGIHDDEVYSDYNL